MIQGEIHTFPLPDLIQWLALTRRTGELTMARGAHRLKLYFDQGEIADSASSDLVEPVVESLRPDLVRNALGAALGWRLGHFVFRDAPLPAEVAAVNLHLATEAL